VRSPVNPDEQRSHKRATDALAARLGNVETVAERFETVETVVEGLGTWLARWSKGVVEQLEASEKRAAAADLALAALRRELTAAQARILMLEAPPATRVGRLCAWAGVGR